MLVWLVVGGYLISASRVEKLQRMLANGIHSIPGSAGSVPPPTLNEQKNIVAIFHLPVLDVIARSFFFNNKQRKLPSMTKDVGKKLMHSVYQPRLEY